MNSLVQLDQYTPLVSELTGKTIYLNDSMDMYLIPPSWSSQATSEVAIAWTNRMMALANTARPTPGTRKVVQKMEDCRTREEFGLILNSLLVDEFASKLGKGSIYLTQRHIVELMLSLWSAGCVAWPAKSQAPFSNPAIFVDNRGFSESSREFLTKIRNYLDRGISDDAGNFRFLLDHILSRAGISDIGDLTPTTFYLTKERSRLGRLRSHGMNAVLTILREKYYEKAITWIAEDFGFFKDKMGHLARDDNFEWLKSAEPAMEQWANLAAEHLAKNPTNYKKRKSTLNNFFKHHLENPDLPRNPIEYLDIKRKHPSMFKDSSARFRQSAAVLNEFMDEILFKLCVQPDDNETPILMPGFGNPHPKLGYKNVNLGETHREAMPTRLINLAKNILTENDFAWAKEAGGTKDRFRWFNPDTKSFETIWSPVRAYAILIKLLLPARTYQVRMLDSGEGDTLRYCGENKWEPNLGAHKPPKTAKPVEKGIFRRYRRKDGTDGAILYFNTNKTADIDSIVKGYVMPWEKQDALQALLDLRNWQETYNPVKLSTPWTEIVELQKTKHVEDLMKMGSSFFLFRDPAYKSRPDLPVTDVRVRGLWLKLMDEMERRLADAGETLSNGEPIKLVLSRDNKGIPASAAFDLHSLRVSIITAMYEEGVPPEYLMKIVGHATVLMTLYYTKISAEALSLKMDEALIARQRKEQSEMAGFIKKASRPELESAVAFRSPTALDAAQEGTGVGLLVMDHGICPVAAKRCHEGLAVLDPASGVTRYQGVPGGASNCSRCRFFMTGPAFLFGMEAHVNELSYRLKKSSYSFEKAQDKFDELSDLHAQALSGGEPFGRQRDLEIAETAFESATSEVDSIALSLQSAYALTEQCIRIAQQTNGKDLALVVAGGIGQLEAVLAEGHEFEQLNRICISATLFEGLNINWRQPNLERARLFDRILRNSGYAPRFSLLDDEAALHAANAMGQFLYARLSANEVHALVDGRTTLRAVGLEKAFVNQLEQLEPTTLGPRFNTPILDNDND